MEHNDSNLIEIIFERLTAIWFMFSNKLNYYVTFVEIGSKQTCFLTSRKSFVCQDISATLKYFLFFSTFFKKIAASCDLEIALGIFAVYTIFLLIVQSLWDMPACQIEGGM